VYLTKVDIINYNCKNAIRLYGTKSYESNSCYKAKIPSQLLFHGVCPFIRAARRGEMAHWNRRGVNFPQMKLLTALMNANAASRW
jgi:hypothetical protein